MHYSLPLSSTQLQNPHHPTTITSPSHLQQLHSLLIKTNTPLPSLIPFSQIASLCSLSSPSHFHYAQSIFHLHSSKPAIIHWNSHLNSLSSSLNALFLFSRLRHFDLLPNSFTLSFALKAISHQPDKVFVGKCIHSLVVKLEHQCDVFLINTLMHMYSACGDFDSARRVFDKMPMRDVVSWNIVITQLAKRGEVDGARELFDGMPERNVVCWNAMIAGYSQNEKFGEAIELFRRMLEDRKVRPNEVTLVSVLSACANLGALDLGRWIEKYISRRAMELGVFWGNALSDMYAKCGCIADARRVFDRMVERDVISWTIIVSGCAMHGLFEEAFSCFQEMLQDGIKPNDITFMGILSACTHAGLVDEGLRYFDMMSGEFGIDPKVEHYGCVVDLLSRVGRLDEAENLISSMRIPPNAIVWGALLGGCRTYKDVDKGERVAHQIIELQPGHSGSYIYLANVYSSSGRLEEAAKYRLKMREKRVVKTPGCSWIEVNNMVYEFLMGDRSHPQYKEIYSMIGSLRARMELAGYVPNTSVVNQSIDEEEKQDALSMHSEKLAVAFGLISTKEGTAIRVVKNLRVCTDCHDYMKIISKIVRREIVLRDRSRFHHFREGICSCKDFW